MSNNIVLLTPPATKESNFHVDETSTIVLLQLVEDGIKDVLNTSILNVIPS